MKKTIWSYLILFCVCLLVFITIVASAEESLGENIILEEAVGDQTLDRMNYCLPLFMLFQQFNDIFRQNNPAFTACCFGRISAKFTVHANKRVLDAVMVKVSPRFLILAIYKHPFPFIYIQGRYLEKNSSK